MTVEPVIRGWPNLEQVVAGFESRKVCHTPRVHVIEVLEGDASSRGGTPVHEGGRGLSPPQHESEPLATSVEYDAAWGWRSVWV